MWRLRKAVTGYLIQCQLKRLSNQIEAYYGSPLIIIGMHRSGTSLVTRLLREAGGYFGSTLESNSEAVIFVRLNKGILHYFKKSWYSLAPELTTKDLANNSPTLTRIIANQNLLWSEFFADFGKSGVEYKMQLTPAPRARLQKKIFFKKWPTPKENTPFWGWKDPRNTLTLPVWLKLFPNARVVHVIRNGIDTALSLWRRSNSEGAPTCCFDLNYCFNLWEWYVKEGLKWRVLPKKRYHEIYYEDLLNEPMPYLKKLYSFIGIPFENSEKLIDRIDRKNICSNQHWANYPKLLHRALRNDLFLQLGYGGYVDMFQPTLGVRQF